MRLQPTNRPRLPLQNNSCSALKTTWPRPRPRFPRSIALACSATVLFLVGHVFVCNQTELHVVSLYLENEPGEERIIAGPRKAIGSASEVAILNFSEQFTRVAPFRAAHTKVAEIVFDSTNKWQLSIHRMAPYETDKKHNCKQ